MSTDGLATLTDKFKEPLLLEVLCMAPTNSQQRTIINAIRKAYEEWMSKNDMIWKISANKYPEFMDNWLMDIECGRIITRNGSVQEPAIDLIPAATTTQVLNTISSAFGLSTNTPSPRGNDSMKQRIHALEQKIKELEGTIAEKDAELDKKMDDYKERHTISDEDIESLFDEDETEEQEMGENPEIIKKLTHQLDELKIKYQEQEKELVELRELKSLSEDFLTTTIDTNQELSLHQKIVFFVTVTSVMLDKRYTHLGNFASLIAIMCNENQRVVAPKLSRIAHIEKYPELKRTLHHAAQSVSDLLANTLTDATKNDKSQVINKIRENLLLNYPSPDDDV